MFLTHAWGRRLAKAAAGSAVALIAVPAAVGAPAPARPAVVAPAP